MEASIFVKLQRVDIEAMRTVIEKLLREFLETKRLPLTRRPSDPKLSAVEFHENLSELSYSNDSGFYCATALPERKTKRPSPKRPLSVHANRVSDRSESFRIIIQLNKAKFTSRCMSKADAILLEPYAWYYFGQLQHLRRLSLEGVGIERYVLGFALGLLLDEQLASLKADIEVKLRPFDRDVAMNLQNWYMEGRLLSCNTAKYDLFTAHISLGPLVFVELPQVID